ncbi:LysR family transcriptional regulator [Plastorhodobacter daqingensis]|uniref:LysR family transcriptional regulator n=1 Tax=Plastorhodobacter daqingensis TaxID=1387281 RepID=A0ABW2UMH3_9RHOB
MQIPRRFLPSLALLTAFEAAARTESVTEAARELSLTQSAVSRQIRALEAQLGVTLFLRERQTIRLTRAGAAYAREIRDALRKISTASLNLRANPAGGTLTLAVLPTFGTRWLAPRLGGFLALHPEVGVNIVTRLAPFDFALEAVDAAIHFGHADWAGAEMMLFRHEDVVPVCSPALAARFIVRVPADIRRAPLLHLVSRPDAWERWFIAQGVDAADVRGMLFDQFTLVIEAAKAGLGVALLPRFLIADELAAGSLQPLSDSPHPAPEAYYLCWPPDRADHPPLIAFRAWLAETSVRDGAGP